MLTDLRGSWMVGVQEMDTRGVAVTAEAKVVRAKTLDGAWCWHKIVDGECPRWLAIRTWRHEYE
jgi:hypothetical protein